MIADFRPVQPSAIAAAITATRQAGADEMCGLFVPDDAGLYQFITCRNHAAMPQTHFEIAEADFAPYRNRRDIIIVHSHPQGPNYPSHADLALARALGLVCALIAPIAEAPDGSGYELIYFGKPALAPLEGRIYRHGVTDCFGLIRDVFATKYNVILPDVPRDWGWWDEGKNLYLDHLRAYDCVILDDEAELQEGDVFIARLRSPVDNHGGIYCGNGLISHHLAGRHPVDRHRYVTHEPVARLQPYIRYWVRHKSRLTPPLPEEA